MFSNPPPSENQPLRLQEIEGELEITLKREDQIHPDISGNKWRKLKYNFQHAKQNGYQSVLTFGGAFSNHLAAVASAGHQYGLQTHGIVRGEELETQTLNPTLQYCKHKGMALHFVSRTLYRNKKQALASVIIDDKNPYVIPKGGTNALAVNGCAEILTSADNEFDTIAVAVGTGGTMAGLIQSTSDHQHLVGFQVVKDIEIPSRIRTFVSNDRWSLVPTYYEVGYAKTPKALIDFAHSVAGQTGVILDPLYTAPMLWHLIKKSKENTWNFGNRLLMIHTGGHQSIKGINQRLVQQDSSLHWPC
jgi:1-aminocyclopropane-1-carboxylate deaminase